MGRIHSHTLYHLTHGESCRASVTDPDCSTVCGAGAVRGASAASHPPSPPAKATGRGARGLSIWPEDKRSACRWGQATRGTRHTAGRAQPLSTVLALRGPLAKQHAFHKNFSDRICRKSYEHPRTAVRHHQNLLTFSCVCLRSFLV